MVAVVMGNEFSCVSWTRVKRGDKVFSLGAAATPAKLTRVGSDASATYLKSIGEGRFLWPAVLEVTIKLCPLFAAVFHYRNETHICTI